MRKQEIYCFFGEEKAGNSFMLGVKPIHEIKEVRVKHIARGKKSRGKRIVDILVDHIVNNLGGVFGE